MKGRRGSSLPGYEASRVIADDGFAATQSTATAAEEQSAGTDAAALTLGLRLSVAEGQGRTTHMKGALDGFRFRNDQHESDSVPSRARAARARLGLGLNKQNRGRG